MTWTWPGDPYTPIRAVRTKEYKYVRNYWPFSRGWFHFTFDGLAEFDDQPYYGRFKNRTGQRPEEGLYHLESNLHEIENVRNDPEHADAVNRLRQRLRAKSIADDAPITRGAIPPVGFDTEF